MIKSASEMQLRPTILVNSSLCNLKCYYCYCDHTKDERKGIMIDNVLEETIKKFQNEYPNFISFCWHGGEPLVAGIETFSKAIVFQNKYKHIDQVTENRIQTNATLIDERWAKFFKEHQFRIGVSLDGYEKTHNLFRIFSDGSGSFDNTMRGIDLLRQYGVQFSAIFTVTSASVKKPSELYRFILENDLRSVKINPCFGKTNASVDPIEYAHFVNSVFDLWMADDRNSVIISPAVEIMRGFLSGIPHLCHFRNGCYHHIKIDYDGTLLPCDDFLGKSFSFGNILFGSLTDMVNGRSFNDFFQATRDIMAECRSCEWLHLCSGGCSRYSFSGSMEKHANIMCESRKVMFAHIGKVLGKK